MIAIGGNASGKRAAENLRIVELLLSGIGASDKDPADGVTGTVGEPAFAGLKEARVLVKYGGKDCAGHKVLDGAVGKSGAEAFPVTLGPLAIAGLAIGGLTYAG